MEEIEKTSNTSEYLKGIVLNLPEGPGIYQYLNKEGVIIYVGKAKNLKRRVYSYFSKDHQSAKTRMLVSKIADIHYIVVNSEEDALLLENNLIKKIQAKIQRAAEGRQDLPFHLHQQRVFPTHLQDPEDYSRRFELLRSVQPRAFHDGLLELIKKLYPLRTCTWH